MSYITTEHLNIYFEEKGDGAPVLFISGTGGDLRQRPNVLDGPLPKHRRVIAYDQRGLGRTEKPDRPYTMGEYGDDAAALLAALGIEQVDVIGVSFGGMVAQHFAIRHPSMIRKLVLCCTSPGGDMPSYPFHLIPEDLTDFHARNESSGACLGPIFWSFLSYIRRPPYIQQPPYIQRPPYIYI